MAETERLLLQVDAATELLRRHLAEGEQPLDRFERRADRMVENVERKIGEMGARFGPFAQAAESAAQRAQRSFEASFSQVQRLAATALKGPTVDGRINLGTDELRAQAAAAQAQARAYDEIGAAAQRAAAIESDASQATRLFIQATTAARIEAEQKAAALLQEAAALERVQLELVQSGTAVELFVNKHQRVAQAAASAEQLALATRQAAAAQQLLASDAVALRTSLDPMFAAQQRFDAEMERAERLYRAGTISLREYNQAITFARTSLYQHAQSVAGVGTSQRALTVNTNASRIAMQGLSFQAQDTATQLSLGANFFQVFAIQGAQAAGQVAHLQNTVGAIGRFFLGPWGLAITFATMALGAATRNVDWFGSRLDDAVEKLEKDADATELARDAKARFALSLAGVTAALRDQEEALNKSIIGTRTQAEQANIAAKAERDRAVAVRQATEADLAAALAKAEASRDRVPFDMGLGAGVAQRAREEGEVKRLRERLDAAREEVTKAERLVQGTRIGLAEEAGARANDPLAQINRRYDKLIEAARRRADAAAKAGRVITTELTREITAINRAREAELKRERERTAAARSASTANRQFGREIKESDARAIIASIGGRVTSGRRSTADQARIYADKQAGRHVGPVAKPGTSAHETGNAIDVAYGPGITVSSIRKAFADEGVRLRKILNEPTQRVFHVEFGGSQGRVARAQEQLRQRELSEDIKFGDEQRAARRRLLEATRRGADTEEQRDQLAREDVAVEIDAANERVRLQQKKGQFSQAEADQLVALNEATRKQRLQNIATDRAVRIVSQRYEAEEQGLTTRLGQLRLQQDLATTEAERRAVSRQILEIEQEIRRKALERVRDTSDDPATVANARTQLAELPRTEQLERDQDQRRNGSAIEQYRDRLVRATSDMKTALGEVAVGGFSALEDAGSRATGQAVTDLLRLRGVAGDVVGGIINDLARLAIQKAIVKAVGTGFLGLADGGAIADLPGFADGGTPGGRIQGPGTGRSDSILAILGGGKGAIRVSAGEYIVNEQATREYLPLIEAINSRRLPKFADGGRIGSQPRLPTLRSPRLPDVRAAASRRERMELTGRVEVEASPLLLARVRETSAQMVGAAAEPIMAGAESRTIRKIRRPELPGGWG